MNCPSAPATDSPFRYSMSAIKPLKLAIIGCGAVIDELHVPSLRRLTRQGAVRVTALVDRSKERMARFKRVFPEAVCFEDAAAAFRSAGAEAALVASPPGLHRAHVEAAFSNGCHVLCEKPLATSVKDVTELAGMSERLGLILMVGLTRRFFPSLATAGAMLRAGDLGGQVEFRCHEGGVYQWPIASDAPFRREAGGGGVLMDKGVHVLDSLLWLFGPMSVVGAEDDALAGGVEGNCRVKLAGKEVRGVMQLSWDQETANGLHIKGSFGEMRVDPNEFRWIELRRAQGAWERRPCRSSWPASLKAPAPTTKAPRVYEDCIYMQWIQFLRAVALGEPVPVDGRAALTVAAQIEAAYASAAPLPQPWLSAEEQTAAARRHWRNGAKQ